LTLRSDDRVLLLAMPPVKELAAMARILIRGVVVVLAEQNPALAEFSNVMFLDASPANVPWRDGFFTKIYVPRQWERLAASEVVRLLAPGGEIVREGAFS
jgi:hypothetical protein